MTPHAVALSRCLALGWILVAAACSSGGNDAPRVELIAPSDAAEFDIGASVAVQFRASDAEGPVTADVVVVAANGDETALASSVAGTGATQAVAWDTNGFPVGTYRIEVRVRDGSGATATERVSIGVRNVEGALQLVASTPDDGAEDAVRNAPVRLVFNTSVQTDSVSVASVVVRGGSLDEPVPIDGALSVSGNVVRFDPSVPRADGFQPGAFIDVDLPAGGLRNLGGDALAAPVHLSFRVGCVCTDPVPGAPRVDGVTFDPAGEPVATDARITIRFSEPMDPATLEPRVLDEAGDEVPVVPRFEDALDRVHLTPAAGFGAGARTLRVVLAGAPADLAGHGLDAPFSRAFETAANPGAPAAGTIVENFADGTGRMQGDAAWGDDVDFAAQLASPPVTLRVATVDVAALLASTPQGNDLPNDPPLGMGGPAPEGRYCPTANPLTGPGVPLVYFDPPTSAGRRRINLYKPEELGGAGTIVRVAWGPDLDALFVGTYPRVVVRLAHTDSPWLLSGGMDEQFGPDARTVADAPYDVPQVADVNGDGLRNTGFFDWPKMRDLFDYDGTSHLMVEVRAQEGTTWQQMRTWLNVIEVELPDGTMSECNCFEFVCRIGNGGWRQMDSTFDGNFGDPFNNQTEVPPGDPLPPPPPIDRIPDRIVNNPMTGVDVAQFEFATLASQAESRYYDSGVASPDYREPRLTPAVQPCGAQIVIEYAGSTDGVSDATTWTTNIDDLDGFRYVRFRARLRANYWTGARARLDRLQIPFVQAPP